ncbi:MAG: hypothetical protein LBC48_02275, partial [Dysgonamonadaceae bacterium]|nr:hypothetical protein [Dysgonamonadaceae bacterium]
MYSEKLENLINHALIDGVLTEKKKQILFKNAEAEGIDMDEFEMVLEARLYEKQQESKNNDKSAIDEIKSPLENPFMRSARNVSLLNKVTGRQAYLDHKEAKKLKSDSEAKYKEYSEK